MDELRTQAIRTNITNREWITLFNKRCLLMSIEELQADYGSTYDYSNYLFVIDEEDDDEIIEEFINIMMNLYLSKKRKKGRK
jgi:hypothetical protein